MAPIHKTAQIKYTQRQKAAIWDWYKNNPEAGRARDARRRANYEKATMEANRVFKEPDTRNIFHISEQEQAIDTIAENIDTNLDKEDFFNDMDTDEIDR